LADFSFGPLASSSPFSKADNRSCAPTGPLGALLASSVTWPGRRDLQGRQEEVSMKASIIGVGLCALVDRNVVKANIASDGSNILVTISSWL
jgi:hypothetical protein